MIAWVERINPPSVVAAGADPWQHLASSNQREPGADDSSPGVSRVASGVVAAQGGELIDGVTK